MRVVITGGAGFVGARLARTLLEIGHLVNSSGVEEAISKLVILDLVAPSHLPYDPRLEIVVGQANDPLTLQKALSGAHCVFHFASVVSGEAEADLQLGLSVNLDGTRMMLDILAEAKNRPMLIFASSVAVYGDGAVPVSDATTAHPRSSYGAQKVCCELLIGDYSRRGLIDGRSLRFPTIAVRPGKPNKANSSFISNIIREPLAGRATVCPVPMDTEMALMSPKRLIEAIIKVQTISDDEFGWPRTLMLPSVPVSVAQMLDALVQLKGEAARELVCFEINQSIVDMISSWPVDLTSDRAKSFGIETSGTAQEIVEEFVGDLSVEN